MTTEPKPCPWCGGTDIDPEGCWGMDDDDNEGVSALCRDCQAQGPLVVHIGKPSAPNFNATPETMAASIAAWNRRS